MPVDMGTQIEMPQAPTGGENTGQPRRRLPYYQAGGSPPPGLPPPPGGGGSRMEGWPPSQSGAPQPIVPPMGGGFMPPWAQGQGGGAVWPPRTPAAGYGVPTYGGPGTAQPFQRWGQAGAGYPGGINYPRPGNTYPMGGGPGQRPGYGGGMTAQVQPSYALNSPAPNMAYDALARRSY